MEVATLYAKPGPEKLSNLERRAVLNKTEVNKTVVKKESLQANSSSAPQRSVQQKSGALGAFSEVPKRKEELDGAVRDLARVAESAQETAKSTYEKLGRYKDAIQKLHEPLHTMTSDALELRKSFQSIWQADEEERLQSWKALDNELASLN